MGLESSLTALAKQVGDVVGAQFDTPTITRRATERDVDLGSASRVGEQIEEPVNVGIATPGFGGGLRAGVTRVASGARSLVTSARSAVTRPSTPTRTATTASRTPSGPGANARVSPGDLMGPHSGFRAEAGRRLSRAGESPGLLRLMGVKDQSLRGTIRRGLQIGFGLGVTSSFMDGLQNLNETRPDATQPDPEAMGEARRQIMQGNTDEAAAILTQQGFSEDEVDAALTQAVQNAPQANVQDAANLSNRDGPRTIQEEVDSLTQFAETGPRSQPGLSPTQAAGTDAEYRRQLEAQQAFLGMQGAFGQDDMVFTGHQIVPQPFQNRVGSDHPFPQSFQQTFSRTHEIAGQAFTLPREQLVDLQHKLFAGGFYGSAGYEDVNFGAKDPSFFGAFEDFLSFAAMHTQVARRGETEFLTWDEILEGLVEEVGGVESAIEQQTPTYTVSLTDPAAISSTLNQLSENIIGRRVSSEQQQRFVGMMHNQQREAQVSAQKAAQTQPGGTVSVTQPNVQAQAENFLREQFPEEAGGQDMLNQYQSFLDLIGGGGVA